MADKPACCSRRKSAGDELVAIGHGPRHRHEQVARADLAAVEGHAGNLEPRAGAAAGGRFDFGGGP
jgi:hypothetical protein